MNSPLCVTFRRPVLCLWPGRVLALVLLGATLSPLPAGAPRAEAVYPVTDVGTHLKLAYTELQNYLRHLEDIAKYVEMVQHQIEQLRRFGDPNYYIGMLGLDKILAEIHMVQAGIARTIYDVQRVSNGLRALQYTGQGLYRDLSLLPDRFGNRVNYEMSSFKRFDVSGQLADQYNSDMSEYNRRMKSLSSQLVDLLHKYNSASSQMEAEKLKVQITAVEAQMNAAGQVLHASADRFNVHVGTVSQMSMRDAEAQRQIQAQESRQEASALVNGLLDHYR